MLLLWMCLSAAVVIKSVDCGDTCRLDDSDMEGFGTSWMWFPDENGVPHKIDLTYNMDSDLPNGRSIAHPIPVKLLLYTRLNKYNAQPLFSDEYALNSNFNQSVPTKLVFHGWRSNYTSPVDQLIKNGYLDSRRTDVNIIVVDWSELAKNNNYFVAAQDTTSVGRHVAGILDQMVNDKLIDLSTLHLIGHSLGAHAAGATGSNLRSGRVPRISGLDPALPGFGKRRPRNLKLDFGDATFVDVIHTCGGFLGEEEGVGHIDFYPNNGRPSQPGCDFYNDMVCFCSHSKAYEYFATSITRDIYLAQQCTNWDDFKSERCNNHPTTLMGDKVKIGAAGKYYLELLTPAW